MKKVLLTAIGSHDPYSSDGSDGAMIHIVKNCKPKSIYLYFATSMKEKKEEVLKAIKDYLPSIKIKVIDSAIENPADFDDFYRDFAEIITNIREENEDADILLNVTSGSPQMIAALCLEVLAHKEELTPIQVLNPHFTKKDNRCVKPSLMGIRKQVLRRQIKDMLEKWDYVGAYSLLENSKLKFSLRLENLVKHSYKRSIEDKEAKDIASEHLEDIYNELYPYKGNDTTQDKLDFLNILSLKKERDEITDFVFRAYALAENLVVEDIGKSLKGGLNSVFNKGFEKTWNFEKAEKNYPSLLQYLREKNVNLDIKLNSYIYEEIVAGYFKIDDYTKLFSTRDARNNIAHRAKPITVEILDKSYKTSPEELLDILRKRFNHIFKKSKQENIFELFSFLNEQIIKELDKEEKLEKGE